MNQPSVSLFLKTADTHWSTFSFGRPGRRIPTIYMRYCSRRRRGAEMGDTPPVFPSSQRRVVNRFRYPPPPASGWWPMEEAGHMEINRAAQIRQAGGRRLLSKTKQTVGSKLMRERARSGRATRMWKFLDPDLRPGGDPHVSCPGECGGAKLFETDRKTKGAEGPRAQG